MEPTDEDQSMITNVILHDTSEGSVMQGRSYTVEELRDLLHSPDISEEFRERIKAALAIIDAALAALGPWGTAMLVNPDANATSQRVSE